MNLLFGYTGLLSFGQALFFGFGMYGVALGIAKLGLGFWPALGLGVAVSTGMAAVAGSLAVRLTWHYFAIITVVFNIGHKDRNEIFETPPNTCHDIG